MIPTPATNPLPDWISDEKLLRDEAVLFGLSEARPDEKLAAIRLAFSTQTAPLEKQIEQERNAVSALNGASETARQELTSLQQQATVPPPPPMGGVMLGLGLSVAMGAGLAVALQSFIAGLPLLSLMLAGLLALSGCVSTILLVNHQYRARLAHHQTRTAARLATTRMLHQQLTDQTAQKVQQVATLHAAETQLAQVSATRDRLLRLFESEYQLARSVRDRVNNTYSYNE